MSQEDTTPRPRRETVTKRITRRALDEPWVLGGIGATVAAFTYAVSKVYAGNAKAGQIGFRARVAFQGLTVGALLWYAYEKSKQPKERVQVMREINWERLEREEQEARRQSEQQSIFAPDPKLKPDGK